jgi:hypothetical protein
MKKGQGCGGAMIRIFGILLLLALVGYNMVETARLRQEIAELKRERTTGVSTSGGNKAPAIGKDGAALLGEARRHAELAETYLRKKQYGEAQREAALASAAVRKAGEAAKEGGESTLEQLRGAADSLSRSARSLSDSAGALWDKGGSKPPSPSPAKE